MNLHEFRMICTEAHGKETTAEQNKCVYPELWARNGETVEVLQPTMQAEGQLMHYIRFADGMKHEAFDCELI